MPWTAKNFRSRHFKRATPTQAKKAATVANAMLRRGVDEGIAIATGIRRAKGKRPRRR